MIKKKKKKMGNKSMEYKSEVTRENNEVIRKEGEKRWFNAYGKKEPNLDTVPILY